MISRTWSLVVLVAVVACGSKSLDGTCSLTGGGEWSCTSAAGASGFVTVLSQCPPNVGPLVSCPPPPAGFVNVQSAADADCFSCASNGQGAHWTCISQRWEAVGAYSCAQ